MAAALVPAGTTGQPRPQLRRAAMARQNTVATAAGAPVPQAVPVSRGKRGAVGAGTACRRAVRASVAP